MKVETIRQTINAKYITGEENKEKEVTYCFASDLMSDVLTLKVDKILLLTGLCNIQTIRTAEMANIDIIIFCRGKKISEDMIEEAKEEGMTLIECKYSIFQTSGLLYNLGLKAIY
jgi:aspartate-semialdehyde dehydrogenase